MAVVAVAAVAAVAAVVAMMAVVVAVVAVVAMVVAVAVVVVVVVVAVVVSAVAVVVAVYAFDACKRVRPSWYGHVGVSISAWVHPTRKPDGVLFQVTHLPRRTFGEMCTQHATYAPRKENTSRGALLYAYGERERERERESE